MIALHDPRWLFLAVPRNASNSVAAALREQYDGRELDRDHHDMHVPDEWLGYTSFAIHRNPYDHLASLWKRGRAEPDSQFYGPAMTMKFCDFARWAVLAEGPFADIWRPVRQTDYLYQYGWPRVDVWLRYESLDAELYAKTPFREIQLLRLNVGIVADYRDLYDERTAALVYGWARCDFERFGYERDSWYRAEPLLFCECAEPSSLHPSSRERGLRICGRCERMLPFT